MSAFYLSNRNTPNLPWCQEDPEKLGHVLSQFVERHDTFMIPWVQRWFENFMFIYGMHDAVFVKKYGFAIDYDNTRRRAPAINAKSQTNSSRVVFESLVSLLFGNDPDFESLAADQNSTQGRRFQGVIDKLLSCYYERLELSKEFKSFAGNLTCYGMAAAKVDWSPMAGAIRKIPQFIEEEVSLVDAHPEQTLLGIMNTPSALLDESGDPVTTRRLVPLRDEFGKQIVKHEWTGDLRVTSLTPFEYRREMCNAGAHKAKWRQHHRLMDYDDFLAEFADLDGRNANFSRVQPGTMANGAFQYAAKMFLRMNFIQPLTMHDLRRTGIPTVKHDLTQQKVLVIEHYDRPNPEKWPEGRLVVMVNGFVTHITKPQYRTNKQNGWHPFAEASWMNIQPSILPSGPMNDITAKNRELDTLDSLIDTMILRNFGSMVLVKNSEGIDPATLFAEPGLVKSVNDPLSAVAFVRDTQPIPPVTPNLREQKKEDIYELSGARESITGDRSKGVSSGYQQKLQEEREERRLTPVRQELEKMIGEIGEKIVACVKQCGKEHLDEQIVGYLKRNAAGAFTPEDITAFLSTEIDYGVDVKVKAGSTRAKSRAALQATLLELVKTVRPVGDRLNDADVLDKFLKEFDADLLRDKSAIHRERARRENDTFRDVFKLGPSAEGLQIPVVTWFDDDEIHIAEHDAGNAETFDEECTDEFTMFLRIFHVEMHKVQRKEKAGEIPAGSTQNFRAFYNAAIEQPKRGPEQVAQMKQGIDQMKRMQAQPPPPPSGQSPSPGAAQGAPPGQPPPAAPASQTQGGKQAEAKSKQAASDMGGGIGPSPSQAGRPPQ